MRELNFLLSTPAFFFFILNINIYIFDHEILEIPKIPVLLIFFYI